MQSNNTNQPKNTDGFRPSGSDYRPSTDGFNQPAGNYPPAPSYRPPTAPTNSTPQPNYPTPQQPMPYNQPRPAIPNHDELPPPTGKSAAGDNDYAAATKKSKRDELKNTIFTIALFILAPLFAVFMIVFVFQSYVVDGSSMEPTLQNGDRVFILKMPKSIANLQNKEWIPTRNEVIVFKKPNNEDTQLIKRVIGLPGDKVVIKDGTITVYNIDNPQGFDPSAGTEYEDTLATYEPEQNMEANVGQGELFVLGDNRTPGRSLDSHSGLGLVPIDNIVGRLWIRYFPLSSFDVYAYVRQLELAI